LQQGKGRVGKKRTARKRKEGRNGRERTEE